MSGQDLPLFVHWTGVLADILPRTEKFPKRVEDKLGTTGP